jgi:hypothetical protein
MRSLEQLGLRLQRGPHLECRPSFPTQKMEENKSLPERLLFGGMNNLYASFLASSSPSRCHQPAG